MQKNKGFCIDFILVTYYNNKVVKKSDKQNKIVFDIDGGMLYSKIRRKNDIVKDRLQTLKKY